MLVIILCSVLGLSALIALGLHIKEREEYKKSPQGICEELAGDTKKGLLAAALRTWEDGTVSRCCYQYDADGNVTVLEETDTDGDVRRTEYTYDSEGRVTDSRTTKNDSFYEHISYSYDDGGKTVITFYEDGSIKLKQTYDSGENCTGYWEYDTDGSEVLRREYTFNEDGTLAETVIYYEENLDSVETNTYLEDGSLSETILYTNEYKIERWTSYTYNERGQLVQKEASDGDLQFLSMETYEYDGEDHMCRKNTYSDYDTIGSYNCYDYALDGQLLENALFNGNGELQLKGSYSYDEQGRLLSELWTDAEGKQTKRTEYTYCSDETEAVSCRNYDAGDNLGDYYEKKINEENGRVESETGSEKGTGYTETYYYGTK